MGYVSARNNFQNAKNTSDNNQALQNLADGLIDLSRAIESDINKLERELSSIKSRLR